MKSRLCDRLGLNKDQIAGLVSRVIEAMTHPALLAGHREEKGRHVYDRRDYIFISGITFCKKRLNVGTFG